MTEWGIIAAMQAEAAPLIAQMEQKTEETVSGITFTAGRLCGRTAVVAVCGVGKVFAALCAQTMLLRFAPRYVVNTGVAGSLSTALSIGDLVIAGQVVQHDMDTSPLGDPVGMLSGINEIYLPCDTALCRRLTDAAGALGLPHGCGTVASGDQFISDEGKKQWIAGTFQAVACEMEGAAVGQVCFVNRVPFAVVRAISDDASGEARMAYPAFVEMAAARSAALLCRLLEASADI